jgi:hypothetical protein
LKYITLALAFTLAASTAFAQAPPTPNEQALGQKLMQEINYGISCSGSNIALQAEIKRLKDKYEPPKVDAEKKK